MAYFGTVFGIIGMSFGVHGLIAHSRVDKLEKHLKELGILAPDLSSEEEI
jgi:hypothetical protein